MTRKSKSRSVAWVVRGILAVVGLLLLLAEGVTYGQEGAAERREERPVPAKPIHEVLKQHTASLMALPGVVGTAQGECAGKPCIKVFVVEKTADLLKQIPAAIEGYAVEVQETGEIRALDPS